MSLSTESPIINALGIFGRLESSQEDYFQHLQNQYCKLVKGDENFGIFPHLSLIVETEVRVGKLSSYIDLLRALKQFLPLKVAVSEVIIVEEAHLALSFDLKQTERVRNMAEKFMPQATITTHYTKAVRSVPETVRENVIDLLKMTELMTFDDFVLCANKPNNTSIIYSSRSYI